MTEAQTGVPSDDSDKPFHILALSGGGFRGLYTATILEAMEEDFGAPIAEHFDLICGTSAGGLLAMALASGKPAAELRQVFEERRKDIFGSQSCWRRLLGGKAFHAKHPSAGLRSVVESILGELTLGDLPHRVLVPTVNFSTGQPKILKTPHHPSIKHDYTWPLVDAAMATTAAPVYFPLFENKKGVFCDGGLVANAPGYFGLHEAKHFLRIDPRRIKMMAVGTMSAGTTMPGNGKIDRGFLSWKEGLFSLMLSAQESATNFMLKHELADNYLRFDEEVSADQCNDVRALDSVSEAAMRTLRHRASDTFQVGSSDARFKAFKAHRAASPTFYYGTHKNAEPI